MTDFTNIVEMIDDVLNAINLEKQGVLSKALIILNKYNMQEFEQWLDNREGMTSEYLDKLLYKLAKSTLPFFLTPSMSEDGISDILVAAFPDKKDLEVINAARFAVSFEFQSRRIEYKQLGGSLTTKEIIVGTSPVAIVGNAGMALSKYLNTLNKTPKFPKNFTLAAPLEVKINEGNKVNSGGSSVNTKPSNPNCVIGIEGCNCANTGAVTI